MKVIRRRSFWLILALTQFFACNGSRDKDDGPKDDAHSETGNQSGADGHESGEGTLSEKGLFLVKVAWQNEAPRAGTLDNTAVVHFSDASGERLGATLKTFKLFMVSMGHGSIKEEEMVFSQTDEGQWNVAKVYFSMGGPASSWAVDLEAEVDGQTDKARVIIEEEVR